MKTSAAILFAFGSSVVLLCRHVTAAPQVNLIPPGAEHPLKMAKRSSSGPTVPVLYGHPVPRWWPNYAQYRGQQVSPFTQGNRIDPSLLASFKARTANMERVRQ